MNSAPREFPAAISKSFIRTSTLPDIPLLTRRHWINMQTSNRLHRYTCRQMLPIYQPTCICDRCLSSEREGTSTFNRPVHPRWLSKYRTSTACLEDWWDTGSCLCWVTEDRTRDAAAHTGTASRRSRPVLSLGRLTAC